MTGTRPRGLQEQIAEEIRVVMVRRRMTAGELAEMVGWSSSQISRKLGAQSALTVDDLQRIADVLRLPVTDLLPDSASEFITRREWSSSGLAVAA